MRIEAIEAISRLGGDIGPVMTIEHRASRIAPLATVGFIVPICLALLTPFGLIAARAAEQPGLVDTVAGKPIAAIQLATALALLSLALAHFVRRLISGVGRSATVRIDTDSATVEERRLLGTRIWTEPLASYRGIAHHVRTRLSGPRHELILVHPDRARCLLIDLAPCIAEDRVREVCAALRMPEVPARALYEPDRRSRPRSAPIGTEGAAAALA
jgi:hypothetical protein